MGDASTVNLQSGDPDFRTPAHICDAATQAMTEGFTHYCSVIGDNALRESVCARLLANYKISKSSSEILVTNGAAQAIFLVAAAFLGLGDEAVVFDPSYSLYLMIALTYSFFDRGLMITLLTFGNYYYESTIPF